VLTVFASAYPVRVDGALDRHLSRWLWLQYPPFRLDMGGADPGSMLSMDSMPEPCDIR
jgi:hypothetical protein